jgi:hypothetical protein
MGLVLLLTGFSGPMLRPAWGEDKVTFSSTGDKIKLPQSNVPGSPADKPDSFFNSKEPGDLGGMPQSPTSEFPQGMRTKRMLELMDQKKNWMFRTTADLNEARPISESFGVKDASLGMSGPNFTRVVERFLQETNQGHRKNQTRRSNQEEEAEDNRYHDAQRPVSPFEPDKRMGTQGPGDFGANPLAGRGIGEMGLDAGKDSLFRNAFILPNSPMSPVFRADPSDRLDPAYTQKKRMEGFMQMLRGPGAGSPLGGAADIMQNPLADSTQQSLQPVQPRSPGNSAPNARFDPLSSMPQMGGFDRGVLPVGLGASGMQILGSSSLSPAMAPSLEPKYTPLPVPVFAMPQRKF